MARVRLAVSMDIPDGADKERCLLYVHDAVSTWAGSLRPAGAYGEDDEGDPMFYLDRSSIVTDMVSMQGGKRKHVRITGDE